MSSDLTPLQHNLTLINIVTIVASAALVFGLHAFGAGYFSLFGFLILLNLYSIPYHK